MKIRPEEKDTITADREILIDLNLIDDGPNMRTDIDKLTEANEELVQSILANGILQPVAVYPSGERFTLIYGQRRVFCSRQAGMKSIPARIFAPPQDDAEVLILSTQENALRIDGHAIEYAEVLKKIKQIRGWSSDEVARAVCLNPVKVCRLLKLSEQSEAIKQLVKDGRLGLTPALELGKLSPEELQQLIPQIAAGKVTRDQLVGIRKSKEKAKGNAPNRSTRCTAVLGVGRSVTVSGEGLNLEVFIATLEDVLNRARKARPAGIELKTFIAMVKDQCRVE